MICFDVKHVRPGFTLDVAGECESGVLGLYGPSGAGKTTLLHLIAGLEKPTHGQIQIHGRTVLDTNQRVCVPPHKRRIAVVFQDTRLLPHRSVYGNLKYAWKMVPKTQRKFSIADVARWVEIEHLLKRRPSGLSGGERQRVALGRAILSHPSLMLLDEPFSALDVNLKRRLLGIVERLAHESGVPMILISHDLSDILSLTDQLLMLDGGRVVGSGRLDALTRSEEAVRLLREEGLMNTGMAVVDHHDLERDATMLRMLSDCGMTDKRLLSVPRVARAAHDACVRLMLRPSDIALALAPLEYISMQNQSPAIIERVVQVGGRYWVILEGGFPNVVEVTAHAAAELGFVRGKRVWRLYKQSAVMARVMPVMQAGYNYKQQAETDRLTAKQHSDEDPSKSELSPVHL